MSRSWTRAIYQIVWIMFQMCVYAYAISHGQHDTICLEVTDVGPYVNNNHPAPDESGEEPRGPPLVGWAEAASINRDLIMLPWRSKVDGRRFRRSSRTQK